MLLLCCIPPGNAIAFPPQWHLLGPAKVQILVKKEDAYSVPDTGTSLLLLSSTKWLSLWRVRTNPFQTEEVTKKPVLEAFNIYCSHHSSSVVITILSQYGFEETQQRTFAFMQVICQLITNLHSCNNISEVTEGFKSRLKKKKKMLAFITKL